MAVLTAAAGVPDSTVALVCACLGVTTGDATRTGERSVEITLAGQPPELPALRGYIGSEPVDINCVPKCGRRKSILIADMDSTIIPVECIDELADFAGTRAEVSQITERAMRGELEFEDALRARAALLEGLHLDVLQQCYDQRISLTPGARTLVRTMNANGATTALVSGGFDFFTSRVGYEAGFAAIRANRVLSFDDRLMGVVAEPILGRTAKLDALREICQGAGRDAAEVLAIGDGANDLLMIEAAGLGVAYCAKPTLRNRADAVLEHSDLTAALALQGYHEADYLS